MALRPELLFSHLGMLPVVTPGREVVLGKVGDRAELPCNGSVGNNIVFKWMQSTVKILGRQNIFWITGRVAQLPVQGGRHHGLNMPGKL